MDAPLRAARDLILPMLATAAPLVYYLVLSKTDPAWELASVEAMVEQWKEAGIRTRIGGDSTGRPQGRAR